MFSKPTSLATRLFFASAVLLPILLGFSATMLHHAFQRSLRAAEKDTLRSQIYLLIGAAEPTEEGIRLPANLPEPRYSTINSGLYSWVTDAEGNIQWRSRSSDLIVEAALPKITTEPRPGKERFFSVILDAGEYYAISYDTVWHVENEDQLYRFVVLHSQGPLERELAAYRKRLWRWLGGLAVLLIIVQTLIARWGLSPLRRLAADLAKMEAGISQRLAGKYPADIQPVTDNLNKLLASEQAQRERYRNTLSDLAHSLKTPLSVMRGQLENSREHSEREGLITVIDEQITRMSAIVDHQLRRAGAQVVQTPPHKPLQLKPVLERLVSAMHKVYSTKTIRCNIRVSDKLSFRGDEGDLMELVGNLLDNACKYGRQSVNISAAQLGDELEILIEDDGPGVASPLKQAILARGARADTATPGQGIGLAVAVDIVSSYGGSLDINDSSLGGASFRVRIPNQS